MFPRTLQLSPTVELEIDYGVREDAAELLHYLETISGESPFLSFGPGELNMTLEEEEAFIESHANQDNKVLLVGRVEGKIVSLVNIAGRHRQRMRHVGELGISVLQSHWGCGVGRAMLQALLDWSREQDVLKRIQLVTREDNHRGIALYESMGFVRESRLQRETFLEGRYYDSFLYVMFWD